MSGKDDLDRSKDSAEAEAGSVDSPVGSCKDWVGIEAQYDDRWQTKITDKEVRIEVNGGVVADGPLNKSLGTFGLQDGQEHQSVRDLLSQYRVNGVDPGAGKMCLIPTEVETAGIEQQIDDTLVSFENAIRGQVGDYISEWAEHGWYSVPASYRRGLGKGGKAWWDGEVDFWSSVGGAASSAWESIEAGAARTVDWYADQPIWDRVRMINPLTLPWYLGEKAAESIIEGIVELWNRRDDIMKVAKAFVSGSVDAIQAALEALIDLPGEMGELFTDLWKKSNDWVQNMIEVARETDVFQRCFKTIMSVLFMLTPNFWAEMKGMVEGFLIPEIVISIILALIGTLCAAAGAAGIAARVAGIVSKIRKAFTAAGVVGKVLTAFFRYIDDLFKLIGKLSKALRRKIDEAIEGATGTYNRIVRKVSAREANYARRGIIKKNIKVEAELKMGDDKFFDVNQTARNPDVEDFTRKTAIHDDIKVKPGKPKPNRLYGDAHAEIGSMQQAYDKGLRGGKAELFVSGEEVCTFCRSDIKKMAKQLQLDELIVHDSRGTFKWTPGTNKLIPQ